VCKERQSEQETAMTGCHFCMLLSIVYNNITPLLCQRTRSRVTCYQQLVLRFIHAFIHSSVALQSFVWSWPLLQFRNLFYTDGRTPWTKDQPAASPRPSHGTTQTRTQTLTPWVRFEPTITASEQEKTVYALDRAATVIGCSTFQITEILAFDDWLVCRKNVTFRKLDLFLPSGEKVRSVRKSWSRSDVKFSQNTGR
jgi:hypothetical protein